MNATTKSSSWGNCRSRAAVENVRLKPTAAGDLGHPTILSGVDDPDDGHHDPDHDRTEQQVELGLGDVCRECPTQHDEPCDQQTDEDADTSNHRGGNGHDSGEHLGFAAVSESSEGEPRESGPPDARCSDPGPDHREVVVRREDRPEDDRQPQSAPEVAEGVPLRAHLVDGVFCRDVLEEPVIEDVCAHEAELCEEEDRKREHHTAGGGEEQQGGEQGSTVCEDLHELALGGRVVGDCAEHRHCDEEDQRAEPDSEGPQHLAGPAVPSCIPDHFAGEVGGKNRPGDHGRIRRIGPVVHGPSEDGAFVVLDRSGHGPGCYGTGAAEGCSALIVRLARPSGSRPTRIAFSR